MKYDINSGCAGALPAALDTTKNTLSFSGNVNGAASAASYVFTYVKESGTYTIK